MVVFYAVFVVVDHVVVVIVVDDPKIKSNLLSLLKIGSVTAEIMVILSMSTPSYVILCRL